ncbi:MAG: diguanylate cyclase [Thermodesulfovibrionia bacterium]
MKDLKGFLVWGAVIGSVAMFTIVFFTVSYWYRLNVKSDVMRTSRSIADMTYTTLYHVMKKGWTHDEVKEIIESQKELFKRTPYNVEIFRGQLVEEIYGTIRQPTIDKDVFDVFNRGIEGLTEEDNRIRYLFPLKARRECFDCHTNAKAGDVLGVIEIRTDVSNTLREGYKKIIWVMLLLFPIPLIGSFIVANLLSNKVKRSVEALKERIINVNKVSDLSKVRMDEVELIFDDFNAIKRAVNNTIDTLRNIAVDKDILEFEIKVLEKLIITTEVVKDWKEHIKNILIEINKLMEVYCLFSLFVVNKESYDLEIFWRNTPHDETKELFERKIKQLISVHPYFKNINSLSIIHNVTLPLTFLPRLKEELVEVQTKSLILESPGIGGIIGIGVNADMSGDSTRSLVIESILTTLLNVVGSVKAIYKYTKDLEYYATRDPLTDLYNQRVFWELVDKETQRGKRYKSKFAVIMVDIDNFKVINDIYGHIFGDRFLQGIADITRDTFRKEDIICRYESDELGIIAIDSDYEQAFLVAKRLGNAIKEFFIKAPDGVNVRTTVSIGIAVFPDHAESTRELLMIAENMLNKAKGSGKDKVFIPTMEDIKAIQKDLGEKNILITNAMEEKRIIPYFQPVMNVRTKKIDGYESLMRIKLKDRIITASEFIDSASDIGVVSRMEYLLMERIFERVANTRYNGLLFINISPKALVFSEYIPTVRSLVKNYNVNPENIIFEITERDTVRNLTLLEKFVHELKSEGFKFAIDDFGSGFSSFQYVKLFPIDFVKIEGEFIRGMLVEGVVDRAIAEGITTFCRGVGIKTVAEFVENEETLKAIEEMGIEYAQGYLIGKPTPELI